MMEGGARRGRGARLAIALAAIAVIIAGALLWRGRRAPDAAPQAATVPVDAETVRRRDVAVTLDAAGTVTPLAVAPVKPRVDGLLTGLAFREGDIVRQGQLLATIDPRPFRAELARAEATVRKDRALAADLTLNEGRARQLANLGASAVQNADTLKAQASAATATADADAALATAARLNLGFTRITAPIAGRAGLRQVDLGTMVRTSDPVPLVSITQMAPISVLFSVPETRLVDLRDAQQRGAVVVTAMIGDRAVASGTLAAIDSTVDPTSGQIRLRATFPNADRVLWPGEHVTARIALATLAGAVTVSDQAILNGADGPYVYVVDRRGAANARRIVPGPSAAGVTAVSAGLRPDELVVASGQSRLRPGSIVAIQRRRR